MSQHLEHLKWRYATKKFDPTKKLSKEQLEHLLEAVRLSASSYGLQPYQIFVITDPELRKQLRSHSHDQAQVMDASHLMIICARTDIGPGYVDDYVDRVVGERGVARESLAAHRETMVKAIEKKGPQETTEWAKRQGYIALGFLLSAAAAMRIDACPMEGFEHDKIDADLGLPKLGLTVVAFCPVGFRADDPSALRKKVRLPADRLFIRR
jgi:nitroreductase / dihydropteridine reductase